MLDASEKKTLVMDTELFIKNIEDCLVALLASPMSPETVSLLSRLDSPEQVSAHVYSSPS
ncbi:hypothetical protein D3C80_2197530 [compost metagenome]